jgi:hypothetical protein
MRRSRIRWTAWLGMGFFRAHNLDSTDFQQRTQHVGCPTMFGNPPMEYSVNVHTGEFDGFAGWLDA